MPEILICLIYVYNFSCIRVDFDWINGWVVVIIYKPFKSYCKIIVWTFNWHNKKCKSCFFILITTFNTPMLWRNFKSLFFSNLEVSLVDGAGPDGVEPISDSVVEAPHPHTDRAKRNTKNKTNSFFITSPPFRCIIA